MDGDIRYEEDASAGENLVKKDAGTGGYPVPTNSEKAAS
jgi:hypothetical protein